MQNEKHKNTHENEICKLNEQIQSNNILLKKNQEDITSQYENKIKNQKAEFLQFKLQMSEQIQNFEI